MDPEPSSAVYSLISIAALIIINGMFVAAEYALISFNPLRSGLDEDTQNSPKNDSSTAWLLRHSEICVASIQLGITFCSLAIGYLGISFFHALLLPYLSASFAGATEFEHLSLGISFVLALLLLTLVHVIFGELFVKAIGTAFPDGTLRILAKPLKIFSQVTYPLSALIYSLANVFLKPLQLTIKHAEHARLSLAEIKRLFSSVPSSAEIGTEQARMIRGVVGFSETIAREVMTPRTDLVTIKVDSSLEEVIKIIMDTGFSRFPVRGERVDDVLGILLARDVMPYIVDKDSVSGTHKIFEVRKVMRQPYYIPGTKAIDELLNEFRRRKLHMAILLDEHGGVDGVVTLEDIIEEIVGDIYDESDEPENDFVRDSNGDLLIGGGVLVADLNEKFDLSIPEGQYDTIAGFIFTCLGQIPRKSDEIYISTDNEIYVNGVPEKPANGNGTKDDSDSTSPDVREGISISVEKVEGHRIEIVRLQFLRETTGQAVTSDESQSLPATSEFKSAVVS
jgi:putative hemolysin